MIFIIMIKNNNFFIFGLEKVKVIIEVFNDLAKIKLGLFFLKR